VRRRIATARAACLIAAVAGAACSGPTIHIEWHRETVPTNLLLARTDGFVHADEQGILRGETFTHYTVPDDGSPVLYSDQKIDKYYRGKDIHVVATFLDGNGLVLYEGETSLHVEDDVTMSIPFSATGP
jgi:hypothetical protein